MSVVFSAVAHASRLLWARWPMLTAWFLAGALVRYVALEIAGWVGAYTAIGGMLLLPLAALGRLTGFVAMFLVLREGMPRLGAIAPLPIDPRERREQFRSSLLGAILPFFAFYTAWRFLREDAAYYFTRVLEVSAGLGLQAVVDGTAQVGDAALGEIGLGPLTLVLVALTYGLRWALKRWKARLPRWSAFGEVYLEAVWVWLSLYAIADLIERFAAWVGQRQGVVWLEELRAGLVPNLEWATAIWNGIEWVLAQAGGVLLLPLAWLAIAGVVYGRALKASAPTVRSTLVDRAQQRYRTLPERIRRRLGDVGRSLLARFKPLGDAIVLMWRAGPVLIASYVLAFTVLRLLESLLRIALTRLIGPHDLLEFWMVYDALILLAVPLVVEPMRIALVAASYDGALGSLGAREPDVEPRATGREAPDAGPQAPSTTSSRRRNRGSWEGATPSPDDSSASAGGR